MTPIQVLAIVLYSTAAVVAIFGPAIGAVRLVGKYRESKKFEGTFDDFNRAFDAATVHAKALRDTGFGLLEFGFVALGVVLASVASIILVVPA